MGLRGAPSAARHSWRRKGLVGAGVSVSAWLMLAGMALAHHADVTGSVSCGGQVTFQVTSWHGVAVRPGQPADLVGLSRTNRDIVVSLSLDGGSYQPAPVSPVVLDAADHYSFVGRFDLPPLAPHLEQAVVLRVRAGAPWGDGVVDPGTQYSPLLVRHACPPAPSRLVRHASHGADRPAWMLGGGLFAALAAAAATSRRLAPRVRR
jgi:hypothetical protein